jgi:hypothetical protein
LAPIFTLFFLPSCKDANDLFLKAIKKLGHTTFFLGILIIVAKVVGRCCTLSCVLWGGLHSSLFKHEMFLFIYLFIYWECKRMIKAS